MDGAYGVQVSECVCVNCVFIYMRVRVCLHVRMRACVRACVFVLVSRPLVVIG
jgi:hypothetical protein